MANGLKQVSDGAPTVECPNPAAAKVRLAVPGLIGVKLWSEPASSVRFKVVEGTVDG